MNIVVEFGHSNMFIIIFINYQNLFFFFLTKTKICFRPSVMVVVIEVRRSIVRESVRLNLSSLPRMKMS